MTLHRLHLPTRKTGRNNRSMLEHLLRIEEEVLKETLNLGGIPQRREKIKAILQQYKKENQITNPFTYEAIQEYFFNAKKEGFEKEMPIGAYTSSLIEQLEGDSPLVIDLQGKNFNYILRGLNTPRHITIQNTNSHCVGEYAGTHHGNANIHFKNINGNHTGWGIGSYNGNATATFENIHGSWTGSGRGPQTGNTSIVAYNIKGNDNFIEQNGILVLVNPNETPRIEGIDNTETYHQIQTLIAANASPQEILAYIEANK